MGPYNAVTSEWSAGRTCWWNMLQELGACDGNDQTIAEIVHTYTRQANGQ